MADMTVYITEKYNRMFAEITKDLGTQLDKATDLQNMLRALLLPDMIFNGGPLTLDRIQVMENGDFRILPMPPVPADTCIEEVSKEFGKKNGKKDHKEVENVAELVEAQAGD